jgi:hypothetical protein
MSYGSKSFGSDQYGGKIYYRIAGQVLAGVLSLGGTAVKWVEKILTGTFLFEGVLSIASVLYKTLTAIITFIGSVTTLPSKIIVGGLSFSGNLGRLLNRTLLGSLTWGGVVSGIPVVIANTMKVLFSYFLKPSITFILKTPSIGFTISIPSLSFTLCTPSVSFAIKSSSLEFTRIY